MNARDGSSPSGLSPEFWARVTATRHRLLMLDYDGTLVPFRVDRLEPRISREARAALRDIARHSRVVVVSGRPIGELALMLEGLDLDLVGEHGWEERRHGGATSRHPLPANAERVLEEAWKRSRKHVWAGHIERKRTSLMLHTRGLDAEEARRFEDEASGTWASLEPGTLDLRKVSGGVELRSRGADKGTAVLRLLAETPRGAVVVYLGDDETDEDAFAALAGRGVGIRVGPLQATRASVTLPDTQAVLKFLESWRSVTSR